MLKLLELYNQRHREAYGGKFLRRVVGYEDGIVKK